MDRTHIGWAPPFDPCSLAAEILERGISQEYLGVPKNILGIATYGLWSIWLWGDVRRVNRVIDVAHR